MNRLIIFGGLPGTGKSTIAKKLAKKLGAVYLRIDSIEQAIKNASRFYNYQNEIEVIAEGYVTAYALAKDNLEIGLTVITDSVNPEEITRSEFRKVAETLNKSFFEIEIVCSDKIKHQERVEARKVTIDGLKQPTWQEVMDRDYQPWTTKRLSIDSAIYTAEEAVEKILDNLS